jgi:TetR/AcrR family transcriptional regulator, cholesterol catabolism regulator
LTPLKNDRTHFEVSPVSLRDRSRIDKEARIRAAALALWKERGFDATTTRAVAERAGIATGTLFLYVRNKEDLVDFVFRGEIDQVVAERYAGLPRRADLVVRLMHLFGGLLEFYGRDLELSRHLVRHAVVARHGPESTAITLAFLHRLAALIAEAHAGGQIVAPSEHEALALHAFSLYLGGVLGVVNGALGVDAATAMVRRALEIHFSGLRPPPAAPARKRRTP